MYEHEQQQDQEDRNDQNASVRFARLGRVLLFIFAAAIPLWFVPLRINVDFGREIAFLLLIASAFVCYLLSGLLTGKFRFVYSSGLVAAGIFLLAASVSTFVSRTPFASAFLADPSAEKWSTLLAGFLVMAVSASMFSRRRDAAIAVAVFLIAAGVEALLTFLSLAFHISVAHTIAPFVQGDGFNVIGTINGLALLYAAGLITAIGFILSPTFRRWQAWVQWAIIASAVLFGANLLIVHFRTAWIVLFVGGLFLSGFMFWMSGRTAGGLGWKYAVSLLILAWSLVMIMVPAPLVGRVSLPAEVSPSAAATLSIARSVYREGAMATLFGSGPATFGRDWMRYKDASINQTVFWSVQFNQGYSLVTTLAATTGIIGLLSFILFALGFLIVALRCLLATAHEAVSDIGQDMGFLVSAVLGFVSMVVIAGLYPASIAFVLLLFFFAGLLMTGLSGSRTQESAGRSGWFWNISEREIAFAQPWSVFASSLAVVLLLSLAIGLAYYEVTRVQSAFAQVAGLDALARGDVGAALSAFARAGVYEPRNPRLGQALTQLNMEKIRGLIAQASRGTNVQNDFQNALQAAIQSSQQALTLAPDDPSLWQTQGGLYEMIIPYVPGADRLAFASYQREIALDPMNPTGRIDLARAGLAAADRMQLTIAQQQQSGQAPAAGGQQEVDVAQLTQARSQILDQVEKILQEAVGLKPDLAAAHFLLAQTALRVGNIQKAIQATENAKLAAPFDIGVAFQLGLLYYQNNNLDQARGEFERAVSLNPQYSNARYFLGLIYDRSGDKDKAISQFEEIAKLNPDNQEVKQIIDNLHIGKAALDGIAPPATPPEQRTQPPVAEGQQRQSSNSIKLVPTASRVPSKK